VTIWAISDLHLSLASDKPMDIFGGNWEDHAGKIAANWQRKVAPDDTVLIAGDISWGISFEQALPDLDWIDQLPGKKVLARGNHDYWWKKINWMRENSPPSINYLQNDSIEIQGHTICGCRGWNVPVEGATGFDQDQKIFQRERLRLQMSLDSAKGAKDLVVMIHFPPFAFVPGNTAKDCADFSQGFVDIIEAGDVKTVIYGHLHSFDVKRAFNGERNGVNYVFTACDGLDFSPVKIA